MNKSMRGTLKKKKKNEGEKTRYLTSIWSIQKAFKEIFSIGSQERGQIYNLIV